QRLGVEGASAVYPQDGMQNQHCGHFGFRAGRKTETTRNLVDLAPAGDFGSRNDNRLARSIRLRGTEARHYERRSSDQKDKPPANAVPTGCDWNGKRLQLHGPPPACGATVVG